MGWVCHLECIACSKPTCSDDNPGDISANDYMTDGVGGIVHWTGGKIPQYGVVIVMVDCVCNLVNLQTVLLRGQEDYQDGGLGPSKAHTQLHISTHLLNLYIFATGTCIYLRWSEWDRYTLTYF